MNNIQARINEALAAKNYREMSILVDVRESMRTEARKPKCNRRSAEQIEADMRKFYAGDNPYLACPVEVEVIHTQYCNCSKCEEAWS